MKEYHPTRLRDEIIIDKLYTVHYFEYSKNYFFPGECHDFWEFVYADKGEFNILAQNEEFTLKQGNIVFHKPNEWHGLHANGETAPNIAIVSFGSRSKKMKWFENKVLPVGQQEKKLISGIITEYKKVFSTVLDNPDTTALTRLKSPTIGSEQLIKLYLTQLLLTFIRNDNTAQFSVTRSNSEISGISLIESYMQECLGSRLNMDMIAKRSGMSRSYLYKIFKNNYGIGPIDYYTQMKIEAAKKQIREANFNMTQIAEMLGYSSIHFFSRQFKQSTGMSPTEYANSVKALEK